LTLVVTGEDDLPSLKTPIQSFSLQRGTLTLIEDLPSLSAQDVDAGLNSAYTVELIGRNNGPVPKWLSLNQSTGSSTSLADLSFNAARVPMSELSDSYALELRLTDTVLNVTNTYKIDLKVAPELDRPILPTFILNGLGSLIPNKATPLAALLDVSFMNPLHAIEWTNLPTGLHASWKGVSLPTSFFKSYQVMDGTTVQSLRIPVESVGDIQLTLDSGADIGSVAYRVWSGETDGEYSDDSHFSEWINPFHASLLSDVTRDLLVGTEPVIDSPTGRQAYFGSAFDFEGTADANATFNHGVIADANFGQVFFADAGTGQFSQSRALFSTDTTSTNYRGLAGTPFDDILTANDFGSVLYAGTGGNDLLFGGGASDVLLDGNKFIAEGVTFKDVLVGNAGADSFVLMKPTTQPNGTPETNQPKGTLEVTISDYNPMEGDRLILAGFGTEEPVIGPVDEVTHLQQVSLDAGHLLLWVDLSFVRLVDNHFNLRISDFDKIA